MPEFILITKSCPSPPKYIHRDVDLAIAEAIRLSNLYDEDIIIAEVVGRIKRVEIPVTERKAQLYPNDRLNNLKTNDDLPF